MQMLHGSIANTSIVQPQHAPKYGPRSAIRRDDDMKREPEPMAYTTHTRTFSLSMLERVGVIGARLSEAAARRKVYNTTLRELSALTQRELDDLGLHRSTIKSVAYEAAYGK